MSGILYIVATPIGNLGDITFRAVETLKQADIVACEDTRHTEKLLRHFGLQKKVARYDEHSHASAAPRLIEMLTAGRTVALVTDAGTPAISDPGSRLVHEAVAAGIRVVPVPGPSSVAAAVSAAGLVGDGYVFLGFLPRKKGKATRVLREALGLGRTVAVLESPFRVQSTLTLLKELAPSINVVVAREMTKIHEEFFRGNIESVLHQTEHKNWKGEIVLLIERLGEKMPHNEHE